MRYEFGLYDGNLLSPFMSVEDERDDVDFNDALVISFSGPQIMIPVSLLSSIKAAIDCILLVKGVHRLDRSALLATLPTVKSAIEGGIVCEHAAMVIISKLIEIGGVDEIKG